MKYFFVGYINLTTTQVDLKTYFYNHTDAVNRLENIALEYIKEHQGKQQLTYCVQHNKSLTDVINNVELTHGMFIQSENNSIHLYEKVCNSAQNWYGASYSEYKINKLGTFFITNHILDDFKCKCNVTSKQTVGVNKINNVYLDELMNRLKNNTDGKFGLSKRGTPVLKYDFNEKIKRLV